MSKVNVCESHYDCGECSAFLDYAVEQAHAEAIQAAADVMGTQDGAVLLSVVANRIRTLTPTAARLRGELRMLEAVIAEAESWHADKWCDGVELCDGCPRIKELHTARDAKRAEIAALESHPTELQKRTFEQTAEHVKKVTRPMEHFVTDEPDID